MRAVTFAGATLRQDAPGQWRTLPACHQVQAARWCCNSRRRATEALQPAQIEMAPVEKDERGGMDKVVLKTEKVIGLLCISDPQPAADRGASRAPLCCAPIAAAPATTEPHPTHPGRDRRGLPARRTRDVVQDGVRQGARPARAPVGTASGSWGPVAPMRMPRAHSRTSRAAGLAATVASNPPPPCAHARTSCLSARKRCSSRRRPSGARREAAGVCCTPGAQQAYPRVPARGPACHAATPRCTSTAPHPAPVPCRTAPHPTLPSPAVFRGGVPVCFPQFGQLGPLGQHGFARNSAFTVAEASGSSVAMVRHARAGRGRPGAVGQGAVSMCTSAVTV